MVKGLHLLPRHRKEIVALLHKHLPDVEVWAYGSRVNGQSHDGSDLDLVLRGPKLAEIDTLRLADFIEALQDSTIPFLVEARDWARLPESFHREINREHVVLAAADVKLFGGENSGGAGETIADFVDIVMGQSPPGDTVSGGVGIPLLNGPTEFGPHHPTPVQFTTDARKIAHPGDLLFCVRGSTTGRMNWADQKYAIGRGVAAIRHRCASELQPFVRAIIEFELPELLVQATGSTFPNVSASQLSSISYPNLSAAVQRASAHILGTLADKIELNRRMNETLEAMARALFKSWFVDFDPVRAKRAGRDTGLPKHLADLFPDRMVDSELGEIPEGWEVVPLSEIMNFKEGPGIRHWQYTNSAEGTRFINIRCIQDGDLLLSTSNRITTEQADGKYAHFHLKEGDIVVSSSGTLGRSAVVRKAHLPLLLNTSVIRFRPVGGVTSFSYLHGYLNSSIFLDELKSLASGSVQKNVGPTHLKKMRVLFPPYNCIERYEEIAGPFLQKVNIKRTDNAALAALRDTLLPRLVSGEVRVNVSDQRIEEAM